MTVIHRRYRHRTPIPSERDTEWLQQRIDEAFRARPSGTVTQLPDGIAYHPDPPVFLGLGGIALACTGLLGHLAVQLTIRTHPWAATLAGCLDVLGVACVVAAVLVMRQRNTIRVVDRKVLVLRTRIIEHRVELAADDVTATLVVGSPSRVILAGPRNVQLAELYVSKWADTDALPQWIAETTALFVARAAGAGEKQRPPQQCNGDLRVSTGAFPVRPAD